MRKRRWLGIGAVVVLALGASGAGPPPSPEWRELKGRHFIIHYTGKTRRAVVARLLRRAEGYYDTIAERIGYTRYGGFWTWGDRVRIYLFPDKAGFIASTGQPAWSTGSANRDAEHLGGRVVFTYPRQEDFYDGLLPHEIGHLILHDFIGDPRRLPIWFDEGVAQLQERGRVADARRILKPWIRAGRTVPIKALMRWDVRRETDERKVRLFYAQSVSIVDFLVERYGSRAFGRLCRGLRDGKPFVEALRTATGRRITSLAELERKWIQFMKGR